MKQFRTNRCAEMVSAKLRTDQRHFLETQALARDISICAVIRGLIDSEMRRMRSGDVI